MVPISFHVQSFLLCISGIYSAVNAVSFLLLGDWGLSGSNQTMIAKEMGVWAQQHNASFVVALGDNFYCEYFEDYMIVYSLSEFVLNIFLDFHLQKLMELDQSMIHCGGQPILMYSLHQVCKYPGMQFLVIMIITAILKLRLTFPIITEIIAGQCPITIIQ